MGETTRKQRARLECARAEKCRNKIEHAGKAAIPTHLSRIHFKLAHDLDGRLAPLALVVSGTVHVAKGAVSHLLQQRPPLEARVAGHLAFALALLGHYPRQDRGVNVLPLVGGLLFLVRVVGGPVGGSASLGGDIAVIDGGGRVVAVRRVRLDGLVCVNVGVADGVLARLVLIVALLLGVDGRDVCRRFGIGYPGLLPVADEVFEVLYGAHCFGVCASAGGGGSE